MSSRQRRKYDVNLGLAVGFVLMSIAAGVLLNICLWQAGQLWSAEIRLSHMQQQMQMTRQAHEDEARQARDRLDELLDARVRR